MCALIRSISVFPFFLSGLELHNEKRDAGTYSTSCSCFLTYT